jgi:hypothetical protein
MGEFSPQIDLNKLDVVGLEIAIAHLVKEDQDGHDLTGVQVSSASSLLDPAVEQFLFPVWSVRLPEIIDRQNSSSKLMLDASSWLWLIGVHTFSLLRRHPLIPNSGYNRAQKTTRRWPHEQHQPA